MSAADNLGPQFQRPSPRMKRYLEHERDTLRSNHYLVRKGWAEPCDIGGCGPVAALAEKHFGWPARAGVTTDETGMPVEHAWNELPGGRVLDATIDQFKEQRSMHIGPPDPRRHRHDPRVVGW